MNDPRQEAIAILRDARDRIADPAKWTQRAMYRYEIDEHGIPGDEINAMCAIGAYHLAVEARHLRAGSWEQHMLRIAVFTALRRAASSLIDDFDSQLNPVAQLNDTTDHETVMLMYKLAIHDLEQA